ncbi:MAG: hypothetical protein ACO1TE_08915 [Prosthecobacter sp.]
MTLFPFSPTLLPMADDETRNSDPAGSMSASYDLLSLPGMIISFLDDDTATASSGGGDCCMSTQMLVSHPVRCAEPASVSIASTDSSVMLAGVGDRMRQDGGCANQFRIPFKQPAMIDLAALMMLLGGFVALLVETAEQNLQQSGVLHEASAN